MWQGDAVRNGWAHEWERGLETTVKKRSIIPSATCQLIAQPNFRRLFSVEKYVYMYVYIYIHFFQFSCFKTRIQALIVYRLIAEVY